MVANTKHLAVDVSDVAKTYRGNVQALKGIDLQVHPGEIFGLLGPNGAGKSTLVKILMTIIRPTRCEGTMLGEPIGTSSVLARVGYLPEHLRFPEYLTGRQALHIYGALAKVPKATRDQRMEKLFDIVGMTEWADQRIKTYSKGMKQRVGLAQAMINDPDLIVLDEPTDGVDPVGRKQIREVLLNLKRQGKAVLINSHLLGELELVCDRVAILSKGDVVTQGPIKELTRSSKQYEIALASPMPKNESLKKLLKSLNADVMSSDGKANITIPTDDAKKIQPVIDALRQEKSIIAALELTGQSLEDYFIETVDRSAGGKPVTPGANRP